MSDRFTAVMTALSQDPDLRDRVLAAETPEERAAILVAAGLDIPTAEEVEAAKLAGVDGGSTPLTTVPVKVDSTAASSASHI